MRYKPKSIAAPQLALGGLPDRMGLRSTRISRYPQRPSVNFAMSVWPENLAMSTPKERYSESVVRVSKINIATRTSPKS